MAALRRLYWMLMVCMLIVSGHFVKAQDSTQAARQSRAQTSETDSTVKLEISTDKAEYVFGQPINLFLRFVNNSAAPVAIELNNVPRDGVFGQIRWECAPPGSRQPLLPPGCTGSFAVIPPKKAIEMVLPDVIFSGGIWTFAMTYSAGRGLAAVPISNKCTTEVQSNQVRIRVDGSGRLTAEDIAALNKRMISHVPTLMNMVRMENVSADNYFVILGRYSAPLMVDCLRDDNPFVRAGAAAILGKIGMSPGNPGAGTERQTWFLNNLLTHCGNESSAMVKAALIEALGAFPDASQADRARIVAILQQGLADDEANVRTVSAVSLLRIDRSIGVPSVISRLSTAREFFGLEGSEEVLGALRLATGQSFGLSQSKEWENWWLKANGVLPAGPT